MAEAAAPSHDLPSHQLIYVHPFPKVVVEVLRKKSDLYAVVKRGVDAVILGLDASLYLHPCHYD